MLSRHLLGRLTSGHLIGTSAKAASTYLNLSSTSPESLKWECLVSKGVRVNPCNSMLHPAVIDAGILPDSGQEMCVQEAYAPDSRCFGCGPKHPDGLHVQSRRTPGGLVAKIAFKPVHEAFPGIIQGGIISSVLECHGNWTAAIRLMDMSYLPRPPLTLTATMKVDYKQPTPPNQPLVVKSQVVNVKKSSGIGLSKQSVEVDVFLYKQEPGPDQLLVSATGIFKRRGAARSL